MNKDDEMVLVVPRSALTALGLPGVFAWHENEVRPQLSSVLRTTSRFMRRGDAEKDLRWVQPIPYCVVLSDDESPRILMYDRGSAAAEDRLSNRWSIGVGGHINRVDMRQSSGSASNRSVLDAGNRELGEELIGVESAYPKSWGLFYQEDSPVNSVHLGVALVTQVDYSQLTMMGDRIKKFGWVTPLELKEYQLEGWSETVRDHFLEGMLEMYGSREQ